MNWREWVRVTLSIVAAFNCAAVVMLFSSSQQGDLWPAPGLYFIELILLGLAGLVATAQDKPGAPGWWGLIPWVASGALLAFVVLGGFSIGPFLIPAMLLFAVSGGLADLWYKRSLLRHLVWWAVAAVFQGAVVALASSLLMRA